MNDDGQQTQTQGGSTQDPVAVEQDDAQLEDFLNATPPPEPRGAAYKQTSAFQMFTTIVKLPEHPTTIFDEKYFLYLFAGSLSLSITEKKDILFTKLPGLSQFQIDELVKILEEEKQKFEELQKKHPEQVQKLINDNAREWQMLELEGRQAQAQNQTQSEVDDIKRKLGL
ncbi:MAG: hypothetical protein ACK4NC_00850 [Candidatus Gracilibacteria bacterium]